MSAVTQGEWNRRRAEVKAEAAEVVKANAEQAKKDLIAYRKGQVTTAQAAEASTPEEEGPYDGLTNDELSEILKERELPHSGTKQELIDRLIESDKDSE